LLAQRRLLHAELFSGSRYVPLLSDRNEKPKMPKVHCHISDIMNFAISILWLGVAQTAILSFLGIFETTPFAVCYRGELRVNRVILSVNFPSTPENGHATDL
jgi:hypothetical protein